jgi:hypothetical protein
MGKHFFSGLTQPNTALDTSAPEWDSGDVGVPKRQQFPSQQKALDAFNLQSRKAAGNAFESASLPGFIPDVPEPEIAQGRNFLRIPKIGPEEAPQFTSDEVQPQPTEQGLGERGGGADGSPESLITATFIRPSVAVPSLATPSYGTPAAPQTKKGKLLTLLMGAAQGASDAIAGGALNAPQHGESPFGTGWAAATQGPLQRAMQATAQQKAQTDNQLAQAQIQNIPVARRQAEATAAHTEAETAAMPQETAYKKAQTAKLEDKPPDEVAFNQLVKDGATPSQAYAIMERSKHEPTAYSDWRAQNPIAPVADYVKLAPQAKMDFHVPAPPSFQPQYDNKGNLVGAFNTRSGVVKPLTNTVGAGKFGTGASLSSSDVADLADSIEHGLQPPTVKGLYRNGAPIRAELARRGFNLAKAETDWNATQKHISTLNGPQQERLRQAVQFTSESLPIIENLYNEWKANATGFKTYNHAALAGSKQLPGKPGQIANQLEAQIADLTSELGTVYQGGNSSTDHGLSLAAKNLSADWNEQTFTAALKQIKQNLAIRRNSIMTSQPMGISQNSPYMPTTETAQPTNTAATAPPAAPTGGDFFSKFGGKARQ